MKAYISRKHNQVGGAILVALTICATASLAMASYLLLIKQQNTLSARSQTWNASMAIVEAGVEEALEQLNSNANNLTADGWTFDGTACIRSRTLPDGNSYTVSIFLTNALNPVIISRAYVNPFSITQVNRPSFFATIGYQTEQPQQVTRAVRVTASKGSLFLAAMVAKKGIDLNGNGVQTDSFDSSNPQYSTNGQYDSAKAKDKGDIATNQGIVNALNIGNANIYGHAHTGPGGSADIGPNGGIGSHAWQATHHGIQPDWFVQDSNFTFPETSLPYNNGLNPVSGTVGGTNYDHVLSGGDYYATSLSGKTIVTSASRLVLPNGMSMGSTDKFVIAPGASVTVYSGGSSCTVYGNGVINQPGYASSFILFCTPSVTSFTLNGNAGFTGVLVAPNVDIKMNGGGNNTIDFIGCLMVNSVTMNGHFHFHYDEALGNMAANGRYLITGWDEIP